jgi:hypothetical protein
MILDDSSVAVPVYGPHGALSEAARKVLMLKLRAAGGVGSGRKGHTTEHSTSTRAKAITTEIQRGDIGKQLSQVLGKGSTVDVATHPNAVRAAAAAVPIFQEMKDKGYTLPTEFSVGMTTGTEQSDEPSNEPSGETTHQGGQSGIILSIPASLPADVPLDDAVRVVYADKTAKSPAEHELFFPADLRGKPIQEFADRNFKDLVVHEMGHVNTRRDLSEAEKNAALKIAGDKAFIARAASQVSNYALSSPAEFVAEAFTMQYRGETLKPDAQKLYNLMGGAKIR